MNSAERIIAAYLRRMVTLPASEIEARNDADAIVAALKAARFVIVVNDDEAAS